MEVGTCMFQPKLLFFLVVGNQTESSGKERRVDVAAATRRTKKEKKRGKTFTFALLLSSHFSRNPSRKRKNKILEISRHYFVFDGYIGVVMHLMPGSDAVLLLSRKTYYTASPARN